MRKEATAYAINAAFGTYPDVIINHVPDAIAAYENVRRGRPALELPPMVTVAHGVMDKSLSPLSDIDAFRAYPEHPVITISNGQRKQCPELNHLATIHHGITIGFSPVVEPGGYLLYLARISQGKGPDRAIEIA